MSINLGSAYVSVVPSTRGFGAALKSAIRSELSKVAKQMGEQFSQQIEDGMAKGVEAGLRDAPRKSRKPGEKSGKEFAGAFDKAMRTRVEKALDSLPDAEIGADTSDAEGSIRDLKFQLKELSDQKVGVDISDEEALAKIKAIESGLTKLSNESPSIQVRADSGAALAELAAISAAAEKLDGQNVDIDVKATGMSSVTKLGGQMGLTLGQTALAATTLGSALIPLTAGIAALGAAMAAPLAVAGGGLTVWGALAGVAVKQANENIAAVEKAKTALAGAEKGTQEYSDALLALQTAQKNLTPAQEKFAGSMDGLQKAFVGLVKASGNSLLGPLTKGLRILAGVLPKLAPIVKSVGGVMDDFLTRLGSAVKSPGFKAFIDTFAELAGSTLTKFGNILVNVFTGLFGIFKKFAPVGFGIVDMLEKWSVGFRNAGDNPQFQKFVQYATSQIPVMAAALKSIIAAVGRLIIAFAPIGSVVLVIVKQLADGINNIPIPLLTAGISALIVVVVAWKTAMIAAAATAKILNIAIFTQTGAMGKNTAGTVLATGVTKAYNAVIRIATGLAIRQKIASAAITAVLIAQNIATKAAAAAQWLLNAAMRANPIGIIITALVALGAGMVILYKKSATFRKIVNAAWSGIKNAAQATWEFIQKKVWPGLKTVFSAIAQAAKWLWAKAIQPAFSGIKKAAEILWRGVKLYFTAWKTILTKVIFPVIRFLWEKVVKPVFSSIGDAISFAWNKVIKPAFSAIRKAFGKVGSVLSRIGDVISGVWAGLGDGLGKVVNWIGGKIQSVIAFIQDMIGMIEKATNKLLALVGIKDEDERAAVGDYVKDKTGINIPFMATGGRVAGATLAVIGEGREPETVLPDSVLRGLLVRTHNTGANKGSGAIVNVLRRMVKVLESIADNVGGASLGTTSSTPGANTGNLKGLTKGGPDPDRLKGFTKGDDRPFLVKKMKKDSRGFIKEIERSNKATANMSDVVVHSVKRSSKAWNDLRRGPIDNFNKSYRKTVGGEMPRINDMFEKSTSKTSGRVGNLLSKFRVGPLDGFNKGWSSVFRDKIPGHTDVMDERVRERTGKTGESLKSFSKVISEKVAPNFRSGVDAVGKAWDNVKDKTGKPVKFVIKTVLNDGLIGGFNKIAKFVDTDKMPELSVPKGFHTGGYTGHGAKMEPKGVVHGGEYVIRKESTQALEREQPGFLKRLNEGGADALPGHYKGGFVDPDKRVYLDGEPVSAIHAAQMALASRLSRTPIHVMQGSWQPATSYSGTSHTGPGVADTSPGNFDQQKWLRKVGVAAWGRNFPGAATAGSGAHVHGVSLFSPGARDQGQVDDYLNGGDGLGGSDYGPRPSIIPNINEELARFGNLPSTLGGMVPMLPGWAQKILDAPKKWAKGLLNGGDKLSGSYGGLNQGVLNSLVSPSAKWATDQLGSYSTAGGVPGGPMPGPKQLNKAGADAAKRYAYGRLGAFGFGKNQWSSLQNLWERESGWQWNANNPTSSAYGIPQSLPGSKMASAGADWFTNAGTQVNWGLGYIKGRYGSPDKAWQHSEDVGWYDDGGMWPSGQLGVNLSGEHEAVLTGSEWKHVRAALPIEDGGTAGVNGGRVYGTLDISPGSKAAVQMWAAEDSAQASRSKRAARRQYGY